MSRFADCGPSVSARLAGTCHPSAFVSCHWPPSTGHRSAAAHQGISELPRGARKLEHHPPRRSERAFLRPQHCRRCSRGPRRRSHTRSRARRRTCYQRSTRPIGPLGRCNRTGNQRQGRRYSGTKWWKWGSSWQSPEDVGPGGSVGAILFGGIESDLNETADFKEGRGGVGARSLGLTRGASS